MLKDRQKVRQAITRHLTEKRMYENISNPKLKQTLLDASRGFRNTMEQKDLCTRETMMNKTANYFTSLRMHDNSYKSQRCSVRQSTILTKPSAQGAPHYGY